MKNYSIDFIKEKAKANYELIKLFSVLFITIAVGTVSELKAIALEQEISDIATARNLIVIGGLLSLAFILGFIVYYIIVTNRLLSKLNDTS